MTTIFGNRVPATIPPHVHVWRAPRADYSNRAAIEFSLLGQVCNCGATRVYNGPAYGHTITEPTQPEAA